VAFGPALNNNRDYGVLVLGLGNILLKDEGVGVHVVEQLRKCDLPEYVEVIDGGTSSLDILLLQDNQFKLIVIDAVKAGQEPGTIYQARMTADETDKLTDMLHGQTPQISLHQIGLIETLVMADKLKRAPGEIVIFGVEPCQIKCGLQLTEIVKEKIPQIVNLVLEEIEDAVHQR